MVLRTKEFKEVCQIILMAAGNAEVSTLTETLELVTKGTTLYLNITNREYYLSVKFALDHEEEFHATVNAKNFLDLVTKTTSENITLSTTDTVLTFKGNGTYKIPLIFEGDKLLDLPVIDIDNVTVTMNVAGDILNSILSYNSKEIGKTVAKPVQKMYYMDQEGCLTFTSTSACVNNFTLASPVKVLFNDRLVKLFKLFRNTMTEFKLGYDPISDTIIQTKVSFETPTIKLTAITECDDSLLNSVPVKAIRNRASTVYTHTAVVNKVELLQAIDRLSIFDKNKESILKVTCDANELTIGNGENVEPVKTLTGSNVTDAYSMLLNIESIKTVLNTVAEECINISFGNHQAIVIKRAAVSNILSECRVA